MSGSDVRGCTVIIAADGAIRHGRLAASLLVQVLSLLSADRDKSVLMSTAVRSCFIPQTAQAVAYASLEH